jgi:hypothetical protein
MQWLTIYWDVFELYYNKYCVEPQISMLQEKQPGGMTRIMLGRVNVLSKYGVRMVESNEADAGLSGVPCTDKARRCVQSKS